MPSWKEGEAGSQQEGCLRSLGELGIQTYGLGWAESFGLPWMVGLASAWTLSWHYPQVCSETCSGRDIPDPGAKALVLPEHGAGAGSGLVGNLAWHLGTLPPFS